MTTRPRTRVEKLRLQGIACALGELASAHLEPDLAQKVLKSLGLSVADLEAAGVETFDAEPLKKQ
jgi:hypothetical protein